MCVQASVRALLCLVLWWGTAEEEQFTCTEVRKAGTHVPLLTRAELAPGFSNHAYKCYHSSGLVATGWTLPVTCVMKQALVLRLSCAVLQSEQSLWVPLLFARA